MKSARQLEAAIEAAEEQLRARRHSLRLQGTTLVQEALHCVSLPRLVVALSAVALMRWLRHRLRR